MKTIQEMAREAGFQTGTRDYANGVGSYPVALPIGYNTCLPELEAFAALVREDAQRKPLTMQPVIKDDEGVFRFKRNGLVDALYEHGVKTGLGLNELCCIDFTDEDRQQFAQLIGYSVSGYGSLSYVTDAEYESAAQAAHGIKE